jgi:UDP-MurNAc hydroxylase
VHAELLRPDFIFVSHRHTDHFDVRSLARLCALDPDSVVVTPDSLVAQTATKLGFRTVRVVPPNTYVELDGVRFVTTDSDANRSSFDESIEWGVALCDARGAVVWNQVDTVRHDLADVRQEIGNIARAFGAPAISLGLMRWCPLLEIEATTAGAIGFPYSNYFANLEQIATANPRAIVPSAAGARHVSAFAGLNQLVYPVSEARFERDIRARLPDVDVFMPMVGKYFDVAPDGVACEPSRDQLLAEVAPGYVEDRNFRPIEVPPLRERAGQADSEHRRRIDAWVHGPLRAAVAATREFEGRLLGLEIVFENDSETYELDVRQGSAKVTRSRLGEWDVLNAVVGSALCAVMDGRRAWGDVLLAGELRCATRAYEVDAQGARRARISPVFLYAALAYARSLERLVDYELTQIMGSR